MLPRCGGCRASPVIVAAWIAEAEAERAWLDLNVRQGIPRPRIEEAEIEAMIGKLGDMAAIVRRRFQRQIGRQSADGTQADLPARAKGRAGGDAAR